MSARPFAGQHALVTGGSRGIGAAISRRLAALGATVFVNYVERDAPAQALVAELRARGDLAEAFRADIGEPDEVQALCRFVAERTDRLQVLVLNAGATVFRRAPEFTPAHFDWVMRTNVGSVFTLVQGLLPLLERDGASVVTLSNGAAVRFMDRNALFGAAKAAIEQLTRLLAVELGPKGLRFNCVRPGTVATDVLQVRPDLEAYLQRERTVALGGNTTPEDCANAVAMLCAPEARRITGQVVVVDGGVGLV